MAMMETMHMAEKADKIRRMKIEVIGTKIRTFLTLVDSIKEDNREKESTEMTRVLAAKGQITIEETIMTTKMIKTTTMIKHMAENGLTGVILTLKLSSKFGLERWTEKLGRAIS